MALFGVAMYRADAGIPVYAHETRATESVRPTLAPLPTEGTPRPTLVPGAAPQRTHTAQHPDLCLRLTTVPASVAAPGQIVTYRLITHASGPGQASNLQINMPFESDSQELIDVKFTSQRAWVSAVMTDRVQLRIQSLMRDESITATLQLRTKATAALSQELHTRAQIEKGGQGDTGTISNRVALIIADAPDSRPVARLSIVPVASAATPMFTVSYNDFASHERVSLWYQDADGKAVALEPKETDAQGQLLMTLADTPTTKGDYTLVAKGQCSLVSAVGNFTIP